MSCRTALPPLLVGLALAIPGTAQPPPPAPADEPPIELPEPPDLSHAERLIERARAELEEIAGPALRRSRPPKLPRYPDLGSSDEESRWLRRFHDTPPEEWSAEDRELAAELLGHDLALLDGAELQENALEPPGGISTALDLIHAANRFALRDRLALLEGDEVAAVAGLEERIDLASKMALQRGIIGPLLGSAIQGEALQDVRWLAERSATSAETLERLDAALLRWRLDVPDPATVVALEGLDLAEKLDEEAVEIDPASGVSTMAVFTAPTLRHYATLARLCREHGCRRGIELYREREHEGADVYEAMAHMFLPELLSSLGKLQAFEDLTALGATAVVLRLEALELGAYPSSLADLPPPPAVDPVFLESIEYRPPRSSAAGVELRWPSKQLLDEWPEGMREVKSRLLSWDLPPVPEERFPDEG